MNSITHLKLTLSSKLARLAVLVIAPVVLVASIATAGLPCISTTIIDTSSNPPSGTLVCVNDTCQISCSEVQENTIYGWGTTCTCYPGAIPRCCHLVLVPVGSQWAVVPQGNCADQQEGCPPGYLCTTFTEVDGDVYYSHPKCLGSS